MIALEDVAAHVQTTSAALDGAVCQGQGLILRQLLAAGDHNGHRAGSHDFLEIVAVVGLYQLHAHLCHNAGGKLEEAVGALHVLADGHNAQRRDAVAHARVDAAAQVVDGGELAVRADEGLNRHAVRVHADRVFHVHGQALVAQVVVNHGRAAGHAQRNALLEGRGHAGANRAAGAHEHIHLLLKLRDHQIQTLQTGGRAHEVAMVKREHHSVAADRVKDIGKVTLHAPIRVIRALHVEAALIAKRNIRMIILRDLQSVLICHWNQSSFLKTVHL